jgi:hypothetical protein
MAGVAESDSTIYKGALESAISLEVPSSQGRAIARISSSRSIRKNGRFSCGYMEHLVRSFYCWLANKYFS